MNLGASLQIHSNMHSVCPHLFVSQYTEITYITHTKLHKSDIGSGPSSLSACQLLFTRVGFLPGGWGAGMPVPCSLPACQPACLPASQPASQPSLQSSQTGCCPLRLYSDREYSYCGQLLGHPRPISAPRAVLLHHDGQKILLLTDTGCLCVFIERKRGREVGREQ